MRTNIYGVILLLVFTLPSISQEPIISSETSTIKIDNKTIVVAEDDYDHPLPFKIQYPAFSEERTYYTDVNQLNFIGKLDQPENTIQLLINDKNSEFDNKGLFLEILDLEKGKNEFIIKVIPGAGKIIVVKYIINYQEVQN